MSVVCFGDNNDKLIGTRKDNISILSIEEVYQLYDKKEIDTVIIATRNRFVKEIAIQLSDMGMSNVYMFPEWISRKRITTVNIEKCFIKIDVTKPRLEYFEFHIADHCNLNCKGCGHLCPTITEPSYGNYELYVKDLMRLKELVWGIHRIRLMGGEPLLNKDLGKFIKVTRNIFPDASISVVTNGLLIPKSKPELFRIMYENDCAFDITRYEPTEKVMRKIHILCDMYKIKCNVSAPVKEFFKIRSASGDEDPQKSYEACISKACAYLREGKISTCGAPQRVEWFNKMLQTQIKPGTEDVIDLYDENLDGWTLVEKLASPLEMCRYCKAVPETFAWESIGHNWKKEDWLVGE